MDKEVLHCCGRWRLGDRSLTAPQRPP
jgi:hypothetical protein